MDHPATSFRCSTPSTSVSSMCWSRTLSNRVTRGKRRASNGDGVLLGDEDRPLLKRLVVTTKCLLGSIARPSPTRHKADSRCVPEYQDGIRTTLSRAGDNVPCVA